MSKNNGFFPKKGNPQIYAYRDNNPNYAHLLKVGYTAGDVEERVAQQYPTKRPDDQPYTIVYSENAVRTDGTFFTDKDVHKYLRDTMGIKNPNGEWFECSVADLQSAIVAVKNRIQTVSNRNLSFKMRPEQQQAVDKTYHYFKNTQKEENRIPHFLWNAKMRFGKTFATYQLAKKMEWKKILVLTFKPAVQSAWEEDLQSHIDFQGWQFISKSNGVKYDDVDKNQPIVCFGSFQDYLGKDKQGNIKQENEWVHTINWDCVVLDEYHFGSWREKAKSLFESEDKKEQQFAEGEGLEEFDEDTMPITTSSYLYLSGTPFRAIANGEFIEDQIFNWTYSDEQSAKENWNSDSPNPYQSLPRMVLMTYQLPPSITDVCMGGEFDEFDLNVFFSAEGEGDKAKFKYENDVQKWLDLIRGQHLPTTVDSLKLGAEKPPMPYSDVRLLNILTHTFWFLPSVSSCHAMKNLMMQRHNTFYHDYEIVVSAGKEAGIGIKALKPVQKAMGEPLKTKSITLSCGKLTTGVTVKPWTGIFMLKNLESPETYFQAAFRVQSPWAIKSYDGTEEIIKNECYVFDFAPNRALRQLADYSCQLNVDDVSTEKKVEEFIKFLPVLAYDGSSMKQIDATGILDMAMSGTTATLLAKKWESALLVNVDNYTLQKILANEDALKALENIEGFRNLNSEIQTIINKSDAVKKAKKEGKTAKTDKQVNQDEKELKSKRKKIQEKLIKFATRIPVFMYLTDFREHTLKDVITKLQPDLFKRVTGLNVKDFELLVSLGVFNSSIMNDAVYKFKRYEDSSLSYSGIEKHQGENVGGFDTVITQQEFKRNSILEQSNKDDVNPMILLTK